MAWFAPPVKADVSVSCSDPNIGPSVDCQASASPDVCPTCYNWQLSPSYNWQLSPSTISVMFGGGKPPTYSFNYDPYNRYVHVVAYGPGSTKYTDYVKLNTIPDITSFSCAEASLALIPGGVSTSCSISASDAENEAYEAAGYPLADMQYAIAVVKDAVIIGTYSGTASSYDITFTEVGDYTLVSQVQDGDGANSAQATTSVSVTLVNQSPTADFTATVNNQDVSMDGSSSSDPDDDSLLYSWSYEGGAISLNTSSPTIGPATLPGEGSHDITLKVDDQKGKTDSITKTIFGFCRPGNQLPQNVSVSASPNCWNDNYYVNTAVVYSLAGNDPDGNLKEWLLYDDYEGIRFLAKDINPAGDLDLLGTSVNTSYGQSGNYSAELILNDMCGYQTTDSFSLTVLAGSCPAPNNPPAIQYFQLSGLDGPSVIIAEAYLWRTFQFDATDSDGFIDYYIFNVSGNGVNEDVTIIGGSTSYQHKFTYPVGNYTVSLTAYDNEGASSSTKSLSITITNRPVADFSASPTAGTIPLNVQFTDASSDLDGTVVAWNWNFGDGKNSTIQNPSHTYANAGTYDVTLVATDNNGASNTLSKNNYIKVNDPDNEWPTANFSATPTSGAPPLSVQFTDSSSDPDGEITAWSWNFGDDETSDSQNPNYTYNSSGTYTISLTVTDNGGATDTSTKDNHITANYPPSLTQPRDINQDEDTSSSFELSASDPEGDTLTFSTSGQSFISIPDPNPSPNPNKPTVYVNPGCTDAETYIQSFTVSDGQASDTKNINVIIKPTNSFPYAPSLSSPGNGATITPTGTLDLQWTNNGDCDGDALNFDVYVNGSFQETTSSTSYTISINPNKTYNWYIAARDNGEHAVNSSTWSFTTTGGAVCTDNEQWEACDGCAEGKQRHTITYTPPGCLPDPDVDECIVGACDSCVPCGCDAGKPVDNPLRDQACGPCEPCFIEVAP